MNQEDIVKLISPSAVLERTAEAIPADFRDNIIDEVELEEPDLLLGGEVAARTGGVGLVFFHGRVSVPGHSLPQRVKSDIPSGAGHNHSPRDPLRPDRSPRQEIYTLGHPTLPWEETKEPGRLLRAATVVTLVVTELEFLS